MQDFSIPLVVLAVLWMLVGLVLTFASIGLFIVVVAKMFEKDEQTLAILSIVLTFVTGVGPWIAFVMGWVNVDKWQIRKTMIWWSVTIVASFVWAIMFFFGLVLLAMSVAKTQGAA